MTCLFRPFAATRIAILAAAITALCAGGIAGHSVTKDLSGTTLTSVDGSTAVPNRLNVADRDAGGPELVRTT